MRAVIPATVSFREVRSRFRVAGFHCHHVIPIEVVEMPSLAVLFGHVRACGFNPNDFTSNGTHLPSTEQQAAAFGLPLHRGGHPRYNEMVAELVSPLVRMDPPHALVALRQVQYRLRTALRPSLALSSARRRGPFPAQTDFRRLDAEIGILWQQTAPALTELDIAC